MNFDSGSIICLNQLVLLVVAPEQICVSVQLTLASSLKPFVLPFELVLFLEAVLSCHLTTVSSRDPSSSASLSFLA